MLLLNNEAENKSDPQYRVTSANYSWDFIWTLTSKRLCSFPRDSHGSVAKDHHKQQLHHYWYLDVDHLFSDKQESTEQMSCMWFAAMVSAAPKKMCFFFVCVLVHKKYFKHPANKTVAQYLSDRCNIGSILAHCCTLVELHGVALSCINTGQVQKYEMINQLITNGLIFGFSKMYFHSWKVMQHQ